MPENYNDLNAEDQKRVALVIYVLSRLNPPADATPQELRQFYSDVMQMSGVSPADCSCILDTAGI